jgi:type IV pilus assembly protein PilM
MMGWKLKSRSLRPIGLDIGRSSIKMIQLAMNGGRISVIAADKAPIDSTINGDEQTRRSFVVSAVKRMLDEGSFRGRDVVSCLPNDRLKITSLRLSETGADQIEQALRKEVVQRFGLNPEEDVMDYMLAGDVQQGDEIKNEFILLAADNGTIKSHIEMLEEAELRPVAIDTIPCALFRSFERTLRRQEDKERTLLFVDVGSQFTTVVFGRGGEISFIKQIPIAGEKFNQEISARLGVNISEAGMLRDKFRTEKVPHLSASGLAEAVCDGGEQRPDETTRQVIVDAISAVADELVKEISLCLRYYTVTFRGKRVERAIFTGGEAYESILLNVLRRQLTVELEIAQPLRGFDLSGEGAHVNFDSDRRGLLCEWAVAVGLGLKGWNGANGGKK